VSVCLLQLFVLIVLIVLIVPIVPIVPIVAMVKAINLAMLLLILRTGHADGLENVVKLTKFNFDSNVQRGTWFVKFYAPWCTHCQKLAPIWEKLAEKAISDDLPVKIAEVDCTVSKDVCEKVNVKAFPMLALFNQGHIKNKYQGEASLTGFSTWLDKELSGLPGSASYANGHSTMADTRNTMATEASPLTVMTAIFQNAVLRFPTKNKIINVYIYGLTTLSLLVAGFCIVFRNLDEEQVDCPEHDKDT